MSGSFEDILGLFGVDEPGDISDAWLSFDHD